MGDAALPSNGREADLALESWFEAIEPSSSDGQAWSSVSAWLDSDPLPVTPMARDTRLEDEWGLTRRVEPARPAPKTLLERLDALYQGMVQLERFVQNSTRRDEAMAARATAEPPALPRPRPRLVVGRKEKSHAA